MAVADFEAGGLDRLVNSQDEWTDMLQDIRRQGFVLTLLQTVAFEGLDYRTFTLEYLH